MKYKYIKKVYNDRVVLDNGDELKFFVDSDSDGVFLSFRGYSNGVLFKLFSISRYDFFKKVFNRNSIGGNWPWCNSEEECMILLNALAKETKRLYLIKTEI